MASIHAKITAGTLRQLSTRTYHTQSEKMKSFKSYIADRREKYRLQDEANLKAEFKVKERGGFLWLTHQGVAFMKVANLAQAEEITRELNKARECAVEFEKL